MSEVASCLQWMHNMWRLCWGKPLGKTPSASPCTQVSSSTGTSDCRHWASTLKVRPLQIACRACMQYDVMLQSLSSTPQ